MFLMLRRPPIPTRTDTRGPYTPRCRCIDHEQGEDGDDQRLVDRCRVGLGWIAGRGDFGGKCVLERPDRGRAIVRCDLRGIRHRDGLRSEEHTSELPSLMRIPYAVSCLKKK